MDFVRSIANYKEQYATSKEVMREVLHQISALKNCPYLQPYVFEPSTDLSKPHGISHHYIIKLQYSQTSIRLEYQ
jgi:hypothetical protein